MSRSVSMPLIDVHHHFMPPAYVAAKRETIAAGWPPGLDPSSKTMQSSLDLMDEAGAQASVLSVTSPGVWFGDVAEGRDLARICNECGAGWVRDRPGRFGLFAALPWLDVEGSLREIEYAYDVLGADGVSLMTSYDGRYPGEAEFRPIWDELNRRKAVVHFHPIGSACCGPTVKEIPVATLEFPFDTTRAVASLLMNLVFSRCPDIDFIFSHGGGALPMLADRLASKAAANPALAAQMRGAPLEELRLLNFDTASVTNPIAWAGLNALASPDRILFGSDWPYGPFAPSALQLRGLVADPVVLDLIEQGNARRLFPALAARMG